MKKILSLVVALFMCLSVGVIFSACDGGEDKYWLDVYENVNEYITQDENREYILNRNLEYVKNSTNIKNQFVNYGYEQLNTIYEKCFSVLLTPLSELYGTMQVAPREEKNAKKYFTEFNETFNEYKEDIEEFKESKSEFVRSIEIANLSSDINKQFLREYKREFREFLKETLVVADKFNNIYQDVYYEPPTTDAEATTFSFNAIKYKISNLFVNAQISLLEEYDVDNEDNVSTAFVDKTNVIYYSLDNQAEVSALNFQKYNEYYNLLLTEFDNFSMALENIDLEECEEDLDIYFSNNTLGEVSYDKIQYFINLPALHF